MDPFSYLSVLISIILALGITRLLGGLDDMLQAGSCPRIYWVHIFMDSQSVPVPSHGMVDFLPLACSAALDLFPARFRAYLANDPVSSRPYCYSRAQAAQMKPSITKPIFSTPIIVPSLPTFWPFLADRHH